VIVAPGFSPGGRPGTGDFAPPRIMVFVEGNRRLNGSAPQGHRLFQKTPAQWPLASVGQSNRTSIGPRHHSPGDTKQPVNAGEALHVFVIIFAVFGPRRATRLAVIRVLRLGHLRERRGRLPAAALTAGGRSRNFVGRRTAKRFVGGAAWAGNRRCAIDAEAPAGA